jgi:hypothetical protein
MYRTIFLFIVSLIGCSQNEKPFMLYNVVLLQPNDELQQRIASPRALSDYIKSVENVAKTVAKNHSKQSTSGFVVIAIRPSQKSNVWLDFEGTSNKPFLDELAFKIRSLEPISVRDGLVIFALNVGFWDAKKISRETPEITEWTNAVRRAKRPLEVTEVVDMVWKK